MIALRGGPPCDVLVDIKRIPELGRIAWTADGGLEIGACVPVQDVAEDARIRRDFTALAEGAEAIGSLQIRYRATIGGQPRQRLALHGHRAAAARARRASCASRAEGRRARCRSPTSSSACSKTALAPDELVTAVLVPPPPQGLAQRLRQDQARRAATTSRS